MVVQMKMLYECALTPKQHRKKLAIKAEAVWSGRYCVRTRCTVMPDLTHACKQKSLVKSQHVPGATQQLKKRLQTVGMNNKCVPAITNSWAIICKCQM